MKNKRNITIYNKESQVIEFMDIDRKDYDLREGTLQIIIRKQGKEKKKIRHSLIYPLCNIRKIKVVPHDKD